MVLLLYYVRTITTTKRSKMNNYDNLIDLAFEKIRKLESQNIKPKCFIISEMQWQYATSDNWLRYKSVIETKEGGPMLIGLPVYFTDVDELRIGV